MRTGPRLRAGLPRFCKSTSYLEPAISNSGVASRRPCEPVPPLVQINRKEFSSFLLAQRSPRFFRERKNNLPARLTFPKFQLPRTNFRNTRSQLALLVFHNHRSVFSASGPTACFSPSALGGAGIAPARFNVCLAGRGFRQPISPLCVAATMEGPTVRTLRQ